MFERVHAAPGLHGCCPWHCRIPVDITQNADAVLELRVAPEAAESTSRLTPAEEEVTSLAVRGLSTPAIAARRQCTPRTVKNQLNSVYLKLGISGRRELCVFLASRRRDTKGPCPLARSLAEALGATIDAAAPASLRADQTSCLGRVVKALVAGELSIVGGADAVAGGCLHGKLNPPPLAARHALSRREMQILVLSSGGTSNKATALELGISTSAVSTYLTRARRKLGLDHPEYLISRLAALRTRVESAEVA